MLISLLYVILVLEENSEITRGYRTPIKYSQGWDELRPKLDGCGEGQREDCSEF